MFREKSLKRCLGAMAVIALAMGLTFSGPAAMAGTAQNVILLIGDGMQLEHEIAAGRYFYGNDYGMAWQGGSSYDGYVATWDVDTYDRYASEGGAASYAETNNVNYIWGYNRFQGGDAPHPADSTYYDEYFLTKIDGKYPATDSASAATAMATGLKTDGGNIAWATGDGSDGSLTTIAELFQANGRSIGVTSTVPFSHATPAAFVSHNTYRNNYSEIAEEIVNSTTPDVVIGGGYGSSYYGATDSLIEDIRSKYTYVERTEGVDGNTSLSAAAAQAASSGGKLFGLFGSSGGNFDYATVSDTPGSPSWERGSTENPDMATSVTSALDVLGTNENGFFLMAEQGDIDWANHANHFNNMIGCMYDLDQAARAVSDYINREGDNVTWDNTLVIVTTDHANSYMRLQDTLAAGDLPDSVVTGYSSYGDEILAYTDGSVTYGTGDHTNELVTLHANGAGSELFGTAEGVYYPGSTIIDNTQIYDVMLRASGI